MLLWFAYYELYTPRWSNAIQQELMRVMTSHDISPETATRHIASINSAFPDAEVKDYEHYIPKLELPDKNDCHVLAAAIKANAGTIVTANLKDFPSAILLMFEIEAKHPDDFLTDLIDLNKRQAVDSFRHMVSVKANPLLTEYQMLELLRKAELSNTADYLHACL